MSYLVAKKLAQQTRANHVEVSLVAIEGLDTPRPVLSRCPTAEMSITSDASTVQAENYTKTCSGSPIDIKIVPDARGMNSNSKLPNHKKQQQPQRQLPTDVIPHFAKNGAALTAEERAAIAKRKGLCVQCGIKTHTISVFKKAPLTNDHVYKGICIKCNPTAVPAMVVQAWEVRNPRISSATTQQLVPKHARQIPAVQMQMASATTTATRRVNQYRTSGRQGVKPKNRLEAYTTTDDRDIIPIRDIWKDRDIIPIRDIWKDSLTKEAPPTIQDAQDLWLDSLDREIWEPDAGKPLVAKGTPVDAKSSPAERPTPSVSTAALKSAVPREISPVQGIKEDGASMGSSFDDGDGDVDVLSLGTLNSLDDDNKSGSTFENISAPDSKSYKSGTTGSGWSLCSDGRDPSVVSESQKWNPVSIADEDPSLWAISYQQLMAVEKDFECAFGDAYPNATMHDVNRIYIAPLCKENGKSYALQQNPRGLPVDAFISHGWCEPFSEFVESIRKTFQTWLVKPNLWICAFALNQSCLKCVKDQVGTDDGYHDDCLTNCPFVTALKASKKFVVVRNSASDIYSRIWCIAELMFAQKLKFVPDKTFITGPDCFADSRVSCIDAQATNTDDKAKILRVLLTQYDYKEIDSFVLQFRTQDAPI